MRHGRGKSDRPRVSEKPSNTSGGAPGLAEGVERRGLAQGNLVAPPRGRTPGRGPCYRRGMGCGRGFAPARHAPRPEPGAGGVG